MKILLKAVILFCFFINWTSSPAQADSNRLRISLLTCGPADELYSTWGHTAIRVTDSSSGMDIVFNYGTFDNSDPYFYVKFARGIMRYALSVESYTDFLQEYKEDHRWVIAQELLLNDEQRQRLFGLLRANASETNRFYDYQFYYDNCTTRAKLVISKSTGDSILFKNILKGKAPTFRELFHENLDSCRQYWSEFGIDLVLGSNLDKKASNEQAMFLPDYLMAGFDSATIQGHPLVGPKRTILEGQPLTYGVSIVSPLLVFSLLAILFIWLSFSKSVGANKVLRIADAVYFFVLGLLGIVILLMWLGRVDYVCRNNVNILWLWPTHAVVAFLSPKRYRWKRAYFGVAALIALLLLAGWGWLPQQFNIAFVPLLVVVVVRGYFIRKRGEQVN